MTKEVCTGGIVEPRSAPSSARNCLVAFSHHSTVGAAGVSHGFWASLRLASSGPVACFPREKVLGLLQLPKESCPPTMSTRHLGGLRGSRPAIRSLFFFLVGEKDLEKKNSGKIIRKRGH